MRIPIVLTLISLALSACTALSPAPTPTPAVTATPRPLSLDKADIEAEFTALPAGDAAAGKDAFTARGCVACHSSEPGVRVVGPSIAGLGTRAATTEAGYSAELYLYKSITRPNSHVVETYTAGLMPQNFIDVLPPQTMADMIAFLLTLQ
ncbi:MAG: c-type cytochrome [Anaerolineales bacterium]